MYLHKPSTHIDYVAKLHRNVQHIVLHTTGNYCTVRICVSKPRKGTIIIECKKEKVDPYRILSTVIVASGRGLLGMSQ